MNIGNKIFDLRKKNNLSQEDLAEKLNVTRQTISKWELNETSPDLKQAKVLSELFKVSLDELVDNDVKDLLVERVSNTEKLAGILIKILKVLGIIFIGYIILIVVFFLLMMVYKRQPETSSIKSASLVCTIEDKEYNIDIGSEEYFKCDECDKQMTVYLKDITDWANLNQSITNINTYFNENDGSCINK